MQSSEPALFELNKGTLAALNENNVELKTLNQELLATNQKYNQSFNDKNSWPISTLNYIDFKGL